MIRKFVNRSAELSILEREWMRKGLSLVIVYGRRRVGKTRLLKEFAADKPHLYYVAIESSAGIQAREISKAARDQLGIPITELSDLITFLPRAVGERIVIVLDEFQYLVEADPSLPSNLQRAIDLNPESDVLLILAGSSISFFEKELLGYRSPLFGRRSASIRLKPLKVFQIREFLPSYDIADLVRAYGIVGGTPAYLEKLDPSIDLWENVSRILTPGSYLYDEALNLLRQEVREPRVYFSILASLAGGRDRPSQVASEAGIDPRNLDNYLRLLEELDIVRKERPLGYRRPVKLAVVDNYFSFHFRYVYRMRHLLEMGLVEEALNKVREDFPSYMGRVFENVVEELVPLMYEAKLLPTRPVQVGRWWRKGEEIDLVVRDPGVSTTFIEVKWSGVGEMEARKLVGDLRRKAALSGIISGEEHYMIVCREGSGDGVIDLSKLEPLFH